MIWGIMSGAVMIYGLERSRLNTSTFHTSHEQTERDRSIEKLSTRETEVLNLLAQGLSNAEISSQLYLSEATVKKNIGRIIEKLQVNNRVQAAVLAAQHLHNTD